MGFNAEDPLQAGAPVWYMTEGMDFMGFCGEKNHGKTIGTWWFFMVVDWGIELI